MSAERAVLVTCDNCGVEQTVTAKETVTVPSIHSARLYLSMQGWGKRGVADLCYKQECREESP